jgi:hypothetical protein
MISVPKLVDVVAKIKPLHPERLSVAWLNARTKRELEVVEMVGFLEKYQDRSKLTKPSIVTSS